MRRANMADAHGTEDPKDRGDDTVPACTCGVKLLYLLCFDT